MLKFRRLNVVAFSIILIIIASILIGLYSVEQTLGQTINEVGDHLSVSLDDELLFDEKNVYPGWEDDSIVRVSNVGNNEFYLIVDVHNNSNDNKLFNAMQVDILNTADNNVYYSGPMSEISSINIIKFDSGQEEKLRIKAVLPKGVGNKLQGEKASVSWNFIANVETVTDADTVDPDPAGPDPGVPDVAAPAEPAAADPADAEAADPFEADPDPADPAVAEADPDTPEVVPLTDPVEVPPEAPDIDPDEVAAPVEEVVVDPEEPQVALEDEAAVAGFNYWWLLLLLIIPLLWLLYASSLLVLVPDQDGGYRVVARKIARPKDKQWHVNLEKQLEKYVASYGFVAVDFRGRLLKDAGKAVYAGSNVLGTGRKRYALIGSHRLVTWADDLYKKANLTG